MKILGSNSFYGFTKTTSGDGAITTNGRLASVTSGALTGVAQFEKKFDVKPGATITVGVMARLKSGSRARMALSYPTAQSPKNTEYITSRVWQHYELSLSIPLTHATADFVNVILGQFYEDDGVLEMDRDTLGVSVVDGLPAPRVLAAAKIKILAGVAAVDPAYANHGVSSLTIDLATNSGQLVVQTDHAFRGNSGFYPLPFVTHDGQLARNVHLGASMDNSGLGRVNVVFADAAGALVNLANVASISFNLIVLA